MGGRLNKKFQIMDGFTIGSDSNDPSVYYEGSQFYVDAGLWINGPLRATGAVTVASQIAIGGGTPLKRVFLASYNWNMGAIGGVYGSTNSVIVADVVLSPAAPGDIVHVSPIGSMADTVRVNAMVFSQNVVHLTAIQTGTVGAYTPGAIDFMVEVTKIQ